MYSVRMNDLPSRKEFPAGDSQGGACIQQAARQTAAEQAAHAGARGAGSQAQGSGGGGGGVGQGGPEMSVGSMEAVWGHLAPQEAVTPPLTPSPSVEGGEGLLQFGEHVGAGGGGAGDERAPRYTPPPCVIRPAQTECV